MFISKDCFKDLEIHAMIEKNGSFGDCDITGRQNTIGFDSNNGFSELDLADVFYELLLAYTPQSELPPNYPEERLDYLENHLANDWAIFSDEINNKTIKTIIMDICRELIPPSASIFIEKVGIEKLSDSEYLKENSITKDYDWDSFVQSIKDVNRFHSNHLNLKVLENLFNSESMQQIIRKNESKEFIRGRICEGEILQAAEMGAPPKNKASAGRVNSKGIRCLYLTKDITTSLHEIRARDYDYVSIGSFFPKKNLRVVDLSRIEAISPFNEDNGLGIEWFAINMPILKKISNEIAKPLRRQDSDIDYLPTQYIADYIKGLGFDGLCYNSTLNKGGINYAIFNPGDFTCKSVRLIQVDPVMYSYQNLE